MRAAYDAELKKVQNDILTLGGKVENALIESVEILKNRDFEGSTRLIEADAEINDQRFAIEDHVLTVVATQQPTGHDMRTLAAALDITTELERIGDYAKGIASINLTLGEAPLIISLNNISEMAQKAQTMLHQTLDAFIQQNAETAETIPDEDDAIDHLFNLVFQDIVSTMIDNDTYSDQANYLVWVAHNLERTGDRAVNICERIIYMVTGEMKEFSSTGGH